MASHRGGALLWPENSLRGFRESLALGVDLLELDVHLAADGRVMVIHDAVLDRTTSGWGPVSARTSAELASLRLRDRDGGLTADTVPTLEQVLALLAPAKAGLLCEIKGPQPGAGVAYRRSGTTLDIVPGPVYPGLLEAVVAAVREADLLDRVTLMGFNPAVPRAARAVAPTVRTTLLVAAAHIALVEASAEEIVGWAVDVGATDLGVQYTALTPAFVVAARRAGLRIGAWTVNEEAAMRQVAALGVDVLTTDRPDLALQVVGR